MATQKQIAANKLNAQKSTGPRTAKGKAASAMNALKTGVYAQSTLLRDEDPREFARFRNSIHGEWQPLGPTEFSLVERLVVLLWRQRRLCRAESGLFTMFRQCPEGIAGVATALAREGKETEAFSRLQRLDSAIERGVQLTIRNLQKLQAERELRRGLVTSPPATQSLPIKET